MRLSSLASVAAFPVLLALSIAPSAHAASPPSAGVKRVAKRSPAAPYALPAPAPKDELLPALPPPPPSATAPSAPMVQISAPLPPPFPPTESPAMPVRDAVSPNAAVATTPEVKATGCILQFGMGVLAPTSSFATGASTIGPGASFDLRVGGYATPHVGILVGFRGSYGHDSKLCGESCKGYSIQAPVILQFAEKDRTRGLYGEIGVGFGTTYGGSGNGVTYELSTPLELKLGAGYRLAGANGVRRSATLDLNFGMDVGKIDHAKLTADGAKYDGPVEGATTHLVVAFSLISHFSL